MNYDSTCNSILSSFIYLCLIDSIHNYLWDLLWIYDYLWIMYLSCGLEIEIIIGIQTHILLFILKANVF